jgi:ABC-type uncharacterized transport system substrate-binding protein
MIVMSLFGCSLAMAAPFKVLVVMSYEEDNPWVAENRTGIEAVFGDAAEVTYLYMDTKVDRDAGPAKAKQAFTMFEQLQPDGVIAIDDNAQSMFVLPYLKDRSSVPVMFGGVNADAASYGYPASNVSGVLERAHVRESLAFIKQLVPSVSNACFLTNNVPAGAALRTQVEQEQSSYPIRVHTFYLADTVEAMQTFASDNRAACDTILIDSLEGIAGPNGQPMNNREALDALTEVYDGPILAGNRYQVEQGAWAAVVKTGQEQGGTAAEMLLKAMRGTAMKDLPVTRNTKGQRIINVSVFQARGISLRPIIVRGATLVRQQH